MNWLRTHWSKVSTGLLVVALTGTGALAARLYADIVCCPTVAVMPDERRADDAMCVFQHQHARGRAV